MDTVTGTSTRAWIVSMGSRPGDGEELPIGPQLGAWLHDSSIHDRILTGFYLVQVL